MKVAVYAIIAFTFFSIVSGIANQNLLYPRKRIKELLIFIFPFLFIFLRTFIFDASEEANFYLEVSLSLAAFPLAFFFSSVHYEIKIQKLIGWLFVISTVAITLFGELHVLTKLLHHLGPDKFWKTMEQMVRDPSLPYHVRTIFEETVSIHPTYASLFLGIAVLIIIDAYIASQNNLTKSVKWFYIVLMIFVLFLQIVLASRTPFIGTMLGIFLLLFLHMKNKLKAVYIAVSITAASVLLIVLVPTFSARFKEISMSNTSLPTETHENSFNIRTGIYKCGVNIISKNWLWGIGPGNVQQQLNSCYDGISKEVYDDKNYNTHNQFFDYWAGLGILGPASLMLIFGYVCYTNFIQKRFIPIAIGLLFFLTFLTENLLTRQNGVVSFAFFIGLYFYSQPKIPQSGRP